MLVLPLEGDAALVVPRLEAPRVEPRPELFAIAGVGRDRGPGGDRHRPGRAGPPPAAVGDRTWARSFSRSRPPCPGTPDDVVQVTARCGRSRTTTRSTPCAGLRRRRPGGRRAVGGPSRSSAAPRPTSPRARRPARGRRATRVNFAIVAAGPTPPAPTTTPATASSRPARPSSATSAAPSTATAPTSPAPCSPAAPPESSSTSTPCCRGPRPRRSTPPLSARRARPSTPSPGDLITDGGYGDLLLTAPATASASRSTRTPTSSAATEPLAAGHAFSIEPGIYLHGRWGARIEDIVVATDAGPDPLNRADHALAVIAY